MFRNRKTFFLSFVFLSIFFAPSVFAGGWNVNALSGFGLPGGSIIGIVASIFAWISGVLFFSSLIAFAVSGIMYLTAAGDDGQIEKAKKAMKYSIIGTIVGLSGFVVVQAVDLMLRASGGF